jgi:hypothetical protein
MVQRHDHRTKLVSLNDARPTLFGVDITSRFSRRSLISNGLGRSSACPSSSSNSSAVVSPGPGSVFLLVASSSEEVLDLVTDGFPAFLSVRGRVVVGRVRRHDIGKRGGFGGEEGVGGLTEGKEVKVRLGSALR